MGMIRRLMRGIVRGKGQLRKSAGPVTGAVRAGMHQKSEYEYQHARMDAAAEPVPETAEDALDMPGALEAEIPPVEEEDDEITADIAEGEAEVAPDEGILEEVADPESAEEEETSNNAEVGMRNAELGNTGAAQRSFMAVEYSDKIPVLEPVTGGVSEPKDLLYDPGDGSVKEIQEPLPGMERMGILPFIPGVENPSANVPEAPEPEPEPEPDPEPEPEPVEPETPPAEGD